MSRKTLAGIIVACTVALIVAIVLVIPPLLQTPTPDAVPESDCNSEDAINWDDAKNHIGERTTVCGPVVDTHYASGSSGKPTFLNLGKSYPDPNRFTVVIWIGNRAKFPQPPEVYYNSKIICVRGLIDSYEGVPQIEVTSPDQICEP